MVWVAITILALWLAGLTASVVQRAMAEEQQREAEERRRAARRARVASLLSLEGAKARPGLEALRARLEQRRH